MMDMTALDMAFTEKPMRIGNVAASGLNFPAAAIEATEMVGA